MKMEKERVQKTKKGEYVHQIINTKARAGYLQFIKDKFQKRYDDYGNKLIHFTLKEFIKKAHGGYYGRIHADKNDIAKDREQLRRLVKSRWLAQYKNEEGELTFTATNKFGKYLKEWGYFTNPNSPIMKEKQLKPEKEYYEVKDTTTEKFVGEI